MSDENVPAAGLPVKVSGAGYAVRAMMLVILVGLGVVYVYGLQFGDLLLRVPVHLRIGSGVLFAAVPVIIYWLALRNRPHEIDIRHASGFLALAALLAWNAVDVYNCAADTSEAEVHVVNVVSVANPQDEEGNWVEVASWVRPGETITFEVGDDAFYSVAINSTARIGVKPGALGAPWISSFEVVPPKSGTQRRLDALEKEILDSAASAAGSAPALP